MAYSKTQIASELVGASEAAQLLGVQTSTLTSYLSRGQVLTPLVTLACGPLWLRRDLERWHAQRQSQRA